MEIELYFLHHCILEIIVLTIVNIAALKLPTGLPLGEN